MLLLLLLLLINQLCFCYCWGYGSFLCSRTCICTNKVMFLQVFYSNHTYITSIKCTKGQWYQIKIIICNKDWLFYFSRVALVCNLRFLLKTKPDDVSLSPLQFFAIIFAFPFLYTHKLVVMVVVFLLPCMLSLYTREKGKIQNPRNNLMEFP